MPPRKKSENDEESLLKSPRTSIRCLSSHSLKKKMITSPNFQKDCIIVEHSQNKQKSPEQRENSNKKKQKEFKKVSMLSTILEKPKTISNEANKEARLKEKDIQTLNSPNHLRALSSKKGEKELLSTKVSTVNKKKAKKGVANDQENIFLDKTGQQRRPQQNFVIKSTKVSSSQNSTLLKNKNHLLSTIQSFQFLEGKIQEPSSKKKKLQITQLQARIASSECSTRPIANSPTQNKPSKNEKADNCKRIKRIRSQKYYSLRNNAPSNQIEQQAHSFSSIEQMQQNNQSTIFNNGMATRIIENINNNNQINTNNLRNYYSDENQNISSNNNPDYNQNYQSDDDNYSTDNNNENENGDDRNHRYHDDADDNNSNINMDSFNHNDNSTIFTNNFSSNSNNSNTHNFLRSISNFRNRQAINRNINFINRQNENDSHHNEGGENNLNLRNRQVVFSNVNSNNRYNNNNNNIQRNNRNHNYQRYNNNHNNQIFDENNQIYDQLNHYNSELEYSFLQQRREYEDNIQLQDIPNYMSLTLDLVDFFPVIILKEIENGDKCSICLDDFKMHDYVKKIGCNHHFHPNCIKEWLKHKTTCPNCKTNQWEVVDMSTIFHHHN